MLFISNIRPKTPQRKKTNKREQSFHNIVHIFIMFIFLHNKHITINHSSMSAFKKFNQGKPSSYMFLNCSPSQNLQKSFFFLKKKTIENDN